MSNATSSEPRTASVRRAQPAERNRAFLRAVVEITSCADLSTMLEQTVKAACRLTNAERGTLDLLDDDGVPSDHIVTATDPMTQSLTLVHCADPGVGTHSLDDRLDAAGALSVSLGRDGVTAGHLSMTRRRSGRPFTELDNDLVIALASVASLALEHARVRTTTERQRRSLESMVDLIDVLAPPIEVRNGLVQIARVARRMTGATSTLLLSVPPGGTGSVVADDAPGIGRSEAVLDELFAAARKLHADQRPQEFEVAGRPVVGLSVPAHLVPDCVLLWIFEPQCVPSSPDELAQLASFVDQAALVLDRAKAVTDQEQLAVVTERNRIAHELNDAVIQRLFAVGMELQGVRMLTTAEPGLRIDRAIDAIDATIVEARRAIFALRAE